MKTLHLVIALMSAALLHATEGPESSRPFQEAVAAALKAQDRAAFYKLVDFDGLDSDWVANNKMLIEAYFKEAKLHPGFSGSIAGGPAAMPQPMATQQYNHPIAGAYVIHFGPDAAMRMPLCQVDGNWRVACVMLKKEAGPSGGR